MKKILFTHSYFLRLDPKQWKNGRPYAPLGTLYAASLMRQEGYEVAVKDVQFAESPEEIKPVLEELRPGFFVIYDDGFNYLTKMCLTNMREAAFRMISIAREAGCRVIVSSSDSTDHFEKYLDAGADFILIGEAERTLLELVRGFEGKESDFSHIEGLAFRRGGVTVRTSKRKLITDLDSLPLPAWDLIDIGPYRDMWMKQAGYFSINIGTTRGCPFKCNWCAKPIYGNRYNSRSPASVVEEIKMLGRLFSFDHIWFCDDIFGLKPGWVAAFADLVKKEKLSFRFKIQSRADLLIQENYVASLARAGCEEVWMGAESGSQKILDAMDKGISTGQIRQATALLKNHGIRPCFFIQFGYLGETKEDIGQTIKLINELLPFEIGISVSYPLPGTGFYEKVKDQLKEKTNWADSDDLALMFRNTYPPAYYKLLHRYVHRNYSMHISLMAARSLFRNPLAMNWPGLRKTVAGIYHLPFYILTRIRLKQLEKAL